MADSPQQSSGALRTPMAGGRGGRRRGSTPFDRVMAQAVLRKNAQGSFALRLWRAIADPLTTQSSGLMKNVNIDAIRYRLLRAGFPNGMRATDFLALKWILTVLCGLLFLCLLPLAQVFIGWSVTPITTILAALAGGFYGFKIPDIWLSMVTRRRQTEIQLVLPDMIDLIAVSVEAGLGLYAGIQRVSTRFNNPLSEEFLRMIQEVRLGRGRTDAMRDLTRRMDVPDLATFVTALVQAELLGLAVANVLRVQSVQLRDKRSQRAREQAQKAPIKMIFPLVLFIFPALFVVILGPALLSVIKSGF